MKEGWRKLQVREVLKLEYGKPLPKEDRSANGEFSAYGSNGIKCRTDRAYFDRTSIIVGRKGSAGQITLVDGPFWPLDVTYFVTHDDRQHDIKFLYHLLKRLELPMLADGVKPGINRNRVYDLEAAFPPLPEQKRIVAILDEAFAGIDRAIANTEKNLVNAREIFKSHLNSVLSANGERKHALVDVTTKIGSGATPKGGQKSYKEMGTPLVRSLNVHDGEFRKKNLAFIDDGQALKLNNVIVVKGDVFLNITGASIARCCVTPDFLEGARV